MDCTGVADLSEIESGLRLVMVAVVEARSCPRLSGSISQYLTALNPVFKTNVMITKRLVFLNQV